METITEHLKEVNLVKITTSETNPRSEFNEQSIMELAESIKENGVLQPLLVCLIAFLCHRVSLV